jgi:2-oxoisovalerate ferredoxin oxidoreductase beta subunit
VLALPLTKIAADLGKPMVKNVVALGALQAALRLLPDNALLETLAHVLKDKAAVFPLNKAAFAAGQAAVQPTNLSLSS